MRTRGLVFAPAAHTLPLNHTPHPRAQATVIPTFVAELIRLWYDAASMDQYTGNAEAPHIIVCGDANASRLRVLISQFFHPTRDSNDLAPIVILSENKPEGALKALIEEHKHSGNVRHVRGTGRRPADLRRADAGHAAAVIVLNYRADRDAASADTEVLSTVMAVKNVRPTLRVLAQLARPRKRNALRLVPGWREGDRAIASVALGHTLIGLGASIPGFGTLVTNLVRRARGDAAEGGSAASPGTVTDAAARAWRALMYGEVSSVPTPAQAEPAPGGGGGALRSRTPLEEYSLSMCARVHEMTVTPGLVGLSFAAAARLALVRYGVTLIGATVPVNAALSEVMSALPPTFRLALFPASSKLRSESKLYAIAPSTGDALERFRVDTGGRPRALLVDAVDAVQWNPFTAGGGGAVRLQDDDTDAISAEAHAARADARGGALAGVLSHIPAPALGAAFGGAREWAHNVDAARDVAVPWSWRDAPWVTGASDAGLLGRLGLSGVGGFAGAGDVEAARPRTEMSDVGALLRGGGIVTVSEAAAVKGGAASSPATGGDSAATPSAASAATAAAESPPAPPVAQRKASLGDDGFGGIDDVDDVMSASGGPLMTSAPNLLASGASAAATVAARANANALAVRLALPSAAQASEDLTLVMPTATGMGARTAGASPYAGHVLILGAADAMGYLLRAVGCLAGGARRRAGAGVGDADSGLLAGDVVVLTPTAPAAAALNAMCSGASDLFSRVTFLAGSPADPVDLLRAGVLGARAAIVLTQAKASASADGADNLSDDTETIMITAVIHKLNPSLHIVTELLHGSHAPFIRPTGVNINDAQRAAFAYILEERDATLQRASLDEAIASLERVGATASRTTLLRKLVEQQSRLRAMAPRRGRVGGVAAGAGGALDARAADALSRGRLDDTSALDAAFTSITTSDIVDVLTGVKEDFGGGGAGAIANDGAGFGGAGGGGGAGGASKGSGATNDLFTSPAFAAGRVFAFATLDAVVTEALFEPHTIGIVKALVRAARSGRLVLLPVADAVALLRVADAPAAARTAAAVRAARDAFDAALLARLTSAANGTLPAPAASGGAVDDAAAPQRYAVLAEALVRAWGLLPVGIYRRLHPAAGLRAAPSTARAVAASTGLPSVAGADFAHNRALVSFVFTNPPPETLVNHHDLIYLVRPDDGDDDDADE